jgi:hypothetical protein
VTLYCWQVLEAGEWNIIGAALPDPTGLLGPVSPLVTTRLHVAHMLGFAAVAHHDATGLLVRLARYEEPEIMREVP